MPTIRIYPIFTGSDIVDPKKYVSRRLVELDLPGMPLLVYGRFEDGEIVFMTWQEADAKNETLETIEQEAVRRLGRRTFHNNWGTMDVNGKTVLHAVM